MESKEFALVDYLNHLDRTSLRKHMRKAGIKLKLKPHPKHRVKVSYTKLECVGDAVVKAYERYISRGKDFKNKRGLNNLIRIKNTIKKAMENEM